MYLYNTVLRHLTETDTCYGRNLWRSQEFTTGGGGSGVMSKQNLSDLVWAFVRTCDFKNEMLLT